jgi:polysaccharide pyruvyl transferase WcaK-like protein
MGEAVKAVLGGRSSEANKDFINEPAHNKIASMKVLVKGYYGFGNLGDDILMITTFRLVRRYFADAEICIFSNYSPNLAGFSRDPDYNRYMLKLLEDGEVKVIDWTFKGYFDIVVDGGGGIYFDVRRGKAFFRVLNSISKAIGCIATHRIDRLLRRVFLKPNRIRFGKRIGFGLGIGPHSASAPLFYRHMVDIGSYSGIIVRDKTSMALLDQYKFSAEKSVYTDIAFLKEYWLPALEVPESRTFSGNVGIILMGWKGKEAERFKLFDDVAVALAARGIRVHFISLDENFDTSYISYLSRASDVITWKPNEQSLKDFTDKLSSLDVVITARAHGAIVAAQLGVIPVCLSLSPKLLEVHRMLPNGSLLLEASFTVVRLLNTLDDIEQNYAVYRERLAEDVERNHEIAMRSVNELYNFLT